MPLHRIPKGDADAFARAVEEIERSGARIKYVGETGIEWVILTAGRYGGAEVETR